MSIKGSTGTGGFPFDPERDPRLRDHIARARAFAAREPFEYYLRDTALPDGEVAVIRLGALGPASRSIEVAAGGLNDGILRRANGLALQYFAHNPDDAGPTTIRLRADGHFTATSTAKGEQQGTYDLQPMTDAPARDIMKAEVQRLATGEQLTMVPGIGRVRRIRLGEGGAPPNGVARDK